MKVIAVVCGAGVLTSGMIAAQIAEYFESRGEAISVVQATVMDLLSPAFTADAIVTTVTLPDSIGIPQVSGMPLLIGTDPAPVYANLLEFLAD